MANQLAAVRAFMLAAKQACPEKPTVPDADVRLLRVELIAEELFELACASDVYFRYGTKNGEGTKGNGGAMREPDIIGAADALADLLYVVLGGAIAWGIDIDAVFEEVHRSNMSKFIDGHRRADGKWQKGPSYTPADIKAALYTTD